VVGAGLVVVGGVVGFWLHCSLGRYYLLGILTDINNIVMEQLLTNHYQFIYLLFLLFRE
jgi:hypothetical protein